MHADVDRESKTPQKALFSVGCCSNELVYSIALENWCLSVALYGIRV
jgi:hypothetical protein